MLIPAQRRSCIHVYFVSESGGMPIQKNKTAKTQVNNIYFIWRNLEEKKNNFAISQKKNT